jgi:glutamyl-tRNA synthetase
VDGFDLSGTSPGHLAAVIDLYKIRIKTLAEFGPMADFFFRDDFALDEDGRKKFLDPPENRTRLAEIAGRIESLPDFSAAVLEDLYRSLAAEKGIKASELIHPTRMAVSGKTKGAGLFEMMAVLGRDAVLRRMRRNSP